VATIVVLSVVLAVLLIAFLWFYWYSRTPAWGESETRKAVLRMLIVVGPIFGMHYREPHPEHPTISAPKPRDDADAGEAAPRETAPR
jgi:hypothetical protein